MKIKSRVVFKEAVQWTGKNLKEIRDFMGIVIRPSENNNAILIPTLEGLMEARVKDWIIKGINKEFYPIKPDIFEKSYEVV